MLRAARSTHIARVNLLSPIHCWEVAKNFPRNPQNVQKILPAYPAFRAVQQLHPSFMRRLFVIRVPRCEKLHHRSLHPCRDRGSPKWIQFGGSFPTNWRKRKPAQATPSWLGRILCFANT